MQWKKNILLDLECIALSTNTKTRVRVNRKWKLAGNTNAYCVWVWPELTAGERSLIFGTCCVLSNLKSCIPPISTRFSFDIMKKLASICTTPLVQEFF